MRSGVALSPDLAKWLTKPEAAALLGVSQKTVERHVGRGELEVRMRSRDRARPMAVYDPGQVRRLKDKLAKPAGVLPAEPVVPEAVASERDSWEQLARWLAGVAFAVPPPVAGAVYVSGPEAARIAGLSVQSIADLAATGAVKTMPFGKGVRYRRADLQAL